MGISWQELLVILVIVLVMFGPRRLPEIGSSLGRGIRGFRDSLNGLGEDEPTTPKVLAASGASTSGATAPSMPVAVPVPVEVVEDPSPATTDTPRG